LSSSRSKVYRRSQEEKEEEYQVKKKENQENTRGRRKEERMKPPSGAVHQESNRPGRTFTAATYLSRWVVKTYLYL
jgi:hypothetical protein